MKVLLIFSLAISISLSGLSQQTEKVKGNIATSDTADLRILNIYPDSFPNVSVLFKAQTRKGEPVWNLTKEKMSVNENSENCKVISLGQISKRKIFNLGIVIDHSGSMNTDRADLYIGNDKYYLMTDSGFQLFEPRKEELPPIENAKTAVRNFVKSFNLQKDSISIIGFSNIVDKKLALTQDTAQINLIVNSMKADSTTALYDAMIIGIDEIKNAEGIKVLVALTDGLDNLSKTSWNEVVDKANKEGIPIYIIGLGNVNIEVLQQMAQLTDGQFYYTKTSSSLDSVFATISKQVQAYYELVYTSPNFSALDSTRQIELSFDVEDLYLVTYPKTANFPSEVFKLMAKKDNEKQYLLYGGIALVVLVATGTLLFNYKRKKQEINQPVIIKVFPNPTNGNINLNYQSGTGQLQILNLSGQVVKTFEISGGETQFDLTDLPDGIYLAVIQAEGQQSNAMKFIVKR